MKLAAKKPIFGKRHKQWKNKTGCRCTNAVRVCNAIWASMVVYSENNRYFCIIVKNTVLR